MTLQEDFEFVKAKLQTAEIDGTNLYEHLCKVLEYAALTRRWHQDRTFVVSLSHLIPVLSQAGVENQQRKAKHPPH